MNATSFVIPAPKQPSIAVAGDTKSFPVRRIWCVGRNYLEHIRKWEMTSGRCRFSLPSTPT